MVIKSLSLSAGHPIAAHLLCSMHNKDQWITILFHVKNLQLHAETIITNKVKKKKKKLSLTTTLPFHNTLSALKEEPSSQLSVCFIKIITSLITELHHHQAIQ